MVSAGMVDTARVETHVCCICGEPVSPPYNMVGQRIYCDRHFAVLNKQHTGFWRSAIIQIAFMALLSLAVIVLSGYVGPINDPWRVPVGLALVAIPSALWLYYFYRQDRVRPEPKGRVLEVFLLAMLLTEAVGYPLLTWFGIPGWADTLSATSLLAAILIPGFLWQAITYASIRLVVYSTPHFDRRMDGIIYGTMAGIGVGTLLNLHYVLDSGGVALGQGVVHIVTTVLAQASFGGITGYFMAQAKFEHKPVWWVPAGLTISALMNGLFVWLVSEVGADGLTVVPWRSLLLGVVAAGAAFAILLVLINRATQPVAVASPE